MKVVKNYTRESLAIDVWQSLKEEGVVNTLTRIAAGRGLRETIKVNNGSGFISSVIASGPTSTAWNSIPIGVTGTLTNTDW